MTLLTELSSSSTNNLKGRKATLTVDAPETVALSMHRHGPCRTNSGSVEEQDIRHRGRCRLFRGRRQDIRELDLRATIIERRMLGLILCILEIRPPSVPEHRPALVQHGILHDQWKIPFL